MSLFLLISMLLAVTTGETDNDQPRTNLRAVVDFIFNIGKDFYLPADTNSRFQCPLCDSSVYSYCSDKLLHDACCCLDPYEHRLPRQCRYADCSFLHVNSCEEHKLITACCCSRSNLHY